MKKMAAILFLVFAAQALNAQTWSEWFQQKKTQLKYLGQQIAALEAYGKVLVKGYNIAKDGLQTIGDIKNGEFHLHSDYFSSLQSVNPSVSKYFKIAGIIALQINIVQACGKLTGTVKKSDLFGANERTYIDNVCNNLLQLCNNNIDELISLTTTGKLEMTDAERIKRIDKLYADTQDKYVFIEDFSGGSQSLGLNRAKEQSDVNQLNSYDK